MLRFLTVPACLLASLLTGTSSPGAEAVEELPGLSQASVKSRSDVRPFYFAIPAPRGQILDRRGRPLAQSVAARRLTLVVPPAQRDSLEHFTAWIQEQVSAGVNTFPALRMPDEAALKRHFEHRAELPIAVSSLITSPKAELKMENTPFLVRTEYLRYYPQKDMAAHLLGYVASDGPPPVGPVLHGEPLWQRIRGAAGLESSFNTQLMGTDGLMCMSVAQNGKIADEQVFVAPQAGRDVVTTIQLETQQVAEEALAKAGRRGAVVVVDAFSGDIRALVSNPRFDPNVFAMGMDSDTFEGLATDGSRPLYDRAVQGSYPPGSVFKPIVAMAGLAAHTVDASQRFQCGPVLEIDGREFRNWSDKDYGLFDMRAALIRSCNTYFYQSAMLTRDDAVLHIARQFGYGSAPQVPLAGASAGSLPSRAPSNQDLANLAIGQGTTEASPLQVALAMASMANGLCRPHPRLVMQTQSQTGQTADLQSPARDSLITVNERDLDEVKHAMFGVVNHAYGTAKAARLEKVAVFGKTGTAQWMLNGKEANVVWFAGFIDTTPPLAFAITVEGNPGEKVSGGSNAAPVVAQVLRQIEKKPADHGVEFQTRQVLAENDDLLMSPAPVYVDQSPFSSSPGPAFIRAPATAVRGFFDRLFR